MNSFWEYEIGEHPLKTVENINLLKTDRCVVNILRDSLALPILIDRKTRGYFFHGAGELLIDTIIETTRGAVGESTDRHLAEPFIMVGGTKQVEGRVGPADASDLSREGYENREGFLEKVEDVCKRVFGRRIHCDNFDETHASLFLFTKGEDGEDVLVSKGDKLVYTSEDGVCVFKGEKGVLKRPGVIVVAKKGKTVIKLNDKILIDK